MDLWHLNNMKVILTLWTLNYVDCVPFSWIDSFHIAQNFLFSHLQKTSNLH